MVLTYKFTIVDTDEPIEVSWTDMMDKDAAGYITLPDGRRAREVRDGWRKLRAKGGSDERVQQPGSVVSDSLGFAQHQYEEFEADRKLHGFSGVEYKRDPNVPEFYQVHAKRGSEWDKYLKHRGFIDRNKSDRGVSLAPGELEKAMELARRSESS